MARADKASGAKDGRSGKAKQPKTTKKQSAKRAGSTAASSATSSKKGTNSAGASATSSTKSSPARTSAKKKAVTKPSKSASTKSASAANKAKGGAAKKAPAKKKSPFSAKFLKEMEELLHTERDTYERQAAQLRAEAQSLVEDLDPGDVQFDEESGEGDTIAVERNRDLALASKAQEMIGEIDHALSKFELGTYGICEVSGEPIPNERLEAIPWAREKVEFKVGGFGRR